jgi:hypothetical protein
MHLSRSPLIRSPTLLLLIHAIDTCRQSTTHAESTGDATVAAHSPESPNVVARYASCSGRCCFKKGRRLYCPERTLEPCAPRSACDIGALSTTTTTLFCELVQQFPVCNSSTRPPRRLQLLGVCTARHDRPIAIWKTGRTVPQRELARRVRCRPGQAPARQRLQDTC